MNETKTELSNDEIEIYLHSLAREFNSNKMKQVADRFSELAEQDRQTKWLKLLLDWK
jgi:hypothetical protein